MIFAHDVSVEFAMALCFIARSKNMQESIRTCVFNEVCYSKNRFYMFCVACMIFAHDVALNVAMVLVSGLGRAFAAMSCIEIYLLF